MGDNVKAAAIQSGGGLLGGIVSSISNHIMADKQDQYNSQLMGREFDLNEQAASNAQKRAYQMYDYQYMKNLPSEQRKQLEEAGLSVGLMYGQGGVQGAGGNATASGAEGKGVSGKEAAQRQPIDPLMLSQIKLNAAQAQKELAEANKLDREEGGQEADTKYKQELTETERQMREHLINEKIENVMKAWFDNLDKRTEYFGMSNEDWEKNGGFITDSPYGHRIQVDNKTFKIKTLLNDLTKSALEAGILKERKSKEAAEAIIENERANVAAQKIILEMLKEEADIGLIQKECEHIAWLMGENVNWKSIIDTITGIVDAGAKIYGAGKAGAAMDATRRAMDEFGKANKNR